MKIYLIETSHGSYEDYCTYIETGFFDKDKAQQYVDKYNKDLDDKKLQSDECWNCCSGKYGYLSNVIRNCKLGARRQNISDVNNLDGDLYFECDKSAYDSNIDEQHHAIIKEIEVEE